MNRKLTTRMLSAAVVLLMALSLAVPAMAATTYVIADDDTTVRKGPSTSYSILGTLEEGEVVVKVGTAGVWTKIIFDDEYGYVKTADVSAYNDDDLIIIDNGSSSGTTMAATANVNVRSGPGTNYSKLGELSKGDKVTKVGTTGNWTIINWSTGTAYVSSSYLTPSSGSSGSSSASGTTMVATANVNVRTGPGTNYSILGSLTKGTTITKVGTSGSWTKVVFNGSYAYVSSAYLSVYSGGSSSSTDTTMVATANVNVRSGPGTNYSILGFLTKGTTITKTGTSGSWTKVVYKGSTAYVHSAYLNVYSGSGGSSSSDTLLYAIEDDVPIRSGPSTAYRAIGYLDEGDTVTYLGTSGSSWYKVQFGSQVAYVYAADVWLKGSGSTSGSSGLVYASYSVRVYKEASTSSAMLGYLYAGDTATRTGSSSNGWTRIDFDGRTGYVQTSRITVITGSTSGGSMSTMNRWMYAVDDYTYVYSVPSETKSYREGYLDKNERVWALAGNSDWIKVLIDDEIYYVPADDLRTYSSGGSSSSSDYSVGSYVYVAKYAGAATYANTSRTPLIVDKASGIGTVEYGKLSRGTRLTVKGQVGTLLLVTFRDDRDTTEYTGKTYTAYVDVDLVSSSRP